MYRLYDYLPSGNGYKVRLVLQAAGAAYELIELDIKTARRAPPTSSRRIPTAAFRCWKCRARDICRRATRSSAFLAEGSRARFPTDRVRARAHVAVDVLRAVQPRAEHRHGALLAQLARQDARRARREAGREEEERLRGARRARRRRCATASTWSAIAIRWRTSRCTRTRTSRTKAASISRRIRTIRAWCERVAAAAAAGRRSRRALRSAGSTATAAARSSRSCAALPDRRARAPLPAADRSVRSAR